MPTNPMPQISASDLEAARRFLIAAEPVPDEAQQAESRRPKAARDFAQVTVHHGITRARTRSASRNATS